VAEILAERERPESASELLTVDKAAELAGVNRRTVINWLSSGRLDRFGVNRRPLVSREQLEGLIATKQAKPAPNQGKTRIRTARSPETTFSDLSRLH